MTPCQNLAVCTALVVTLCVCVLPLSAAFWPCPQPPTPGNVAVSPELAWVPQHKYQAEWYYVVGGLCLTNGDGDDDDANDESEWWEDEEWGGRSRCKHPVGFEVTVVLMNVSQPNGGSVVDAYTTLSLNYLDKHWASTQIGLSPIYPNPLQPFDLSFTTNPPLITTTYTLLNGTPGQPGSQYNLIMNSPNATINLLMTSISPLFVHGDTGYVNHNEQSPPFCNTFYYVSMPRLKTEGVIRLNDDIRHVNGEVWWDHQWGVFGINGLGSGWIWVGLRIGVYNVFFEVPRHTFQLNYTRSTVEIQEPDGSLTYGLITSVEILTNWTSPVTRFIYPVELRIHTTHPYVEQIHITPYFLNQEVTTILVITSPQLPIWEGDVKGKVEQGDLAPMKGDGQLELVGYTRLG